MPGSGTLKQQRGRPAPQRTCAACRRVGDQSSFVRLVRVADDDGTRIEVDEGRRRIAGRGTYLCRDAGCWERGLKGALSGSLRMPLEPENREALRAYAARFASTPTTDPSDEGSDQPEGTEGEDA
ncbi:MAG: YlxR family protein [Dehalococcoidia bacterium]|nr:YlxR family protein [Dehalococcoidia bacterium]